MLAYVVEALARQVDALAICGRSWNSLQRLDDRPSSGIGPLGGLNAALRYGADHGFAAILCVPVDVLPLPPDLNDLLSGNDPAVLQNQYLVGRWPTRLAEALDCYIESGGRQVAGWVAHAQARLVEEPTRLHNVNYEHDLEAALTSRPMARE